MSTDFPIRPRKPLSGLTAGSEISSYLLQEQLGAGGMAVVFRAIDQRLNRQVAHKILPPGLAFDEAFRRRFVRESKAAAAIDDPHIIPIFEAGQADQILFIAMRYVPGGDVRTLIQRIGPLPPDRAASIVSQVASALDSAHATGLFHRDVKPGNMLVDIRKDRPDHIYLADFGLSKDVLHSAGLTASGDVIGTAAYLAPEQIQGHQSVDGRSDQYSLACAAFEMLTGKPPFPRDHSAAVIWAHLSEKPPSMVQRRPALPPEIDPVMTRGLAKRPEDRYLSCREFAESLTEVLNSDPARPASSYSGVNFSELTTAPIQIPQRAEEGRGSGVFDILQRTAPVAIPSTSAGQYSNLAGPAGHERFPSQRADSLPSEPGAADDTSPVTQSRFPAATFDIEESYTRDDRNINETDSYSGTTRRSLLIASAVGVSLAAGGITWTLARKGGVALGDGQEKSNRLLWHRTIPVSSLILGASSSLTSCGNLICVA
jgi:serine/threonine protein kinase